ncbi:MAG: thiaminase II [Eubacteriales bacterium]|jgi:thiaminase/transcriptional activator TenA
MKLTDQLYEGVQDIWQGYYTHPFVQGIAHGTLPVEKFRYYMIQDYRYLLDYVKVFALGVVKSDTEELMRYFAKFVYGTLDGEMRVHKSYMARLGITQEEIEQSVSALNNLSYTHYMLTIAHQGDPLDALVSILACAWSYQCIGQEVAKVPGSKDHPFYGEWVRSYSDPDYETGTQDMIDLIDRLGEGCTPEKQARLLEIFRNCSRYEAMFWDMAYAMQ